MSAVVWIESEDEGRAWNRSIQGIGHRLTATEAYCNESQTQSDAAHSLELYRPPPMAGLCITVGRLLEAIVR